MKILTEPEDDMQFYWPSNRIYPSATTRGIFHFMSPSGSVNIFLLTNSNKIREYQRQNNAG